MSRIISLGALSIVCVLALPTYATGQAAATKPNEPALRVGDRVLLYVAGNALLTDTFPVREGSTLRLPTIPDISIAGIPRSSLSIYLSQALKSYVKSPDIRATSLLRIGVLGQVNKPGFYTLSPDALLSDVLMVAGGLTQQADLKKARIRRSGQNSNYQATNNLGNTLDQLGLNGGDEITIGERTESGWRTAMRAGIVAIGLGATIYGVKSAGK